MFIKHFQINNFKIHRNAQVDFFPITVLVGPNSGGKSAIFDALINFSMVCRGNLAEAFNQFPFSFDGLKHHGASANARIGYEIVLSSSETDQSKLNYSIEFSQNAGTESDPVYSIHNEELRVDSAIVFSRSKDVCNIKGLPNISIDDRSIFAAIRRSEWSDEFKSENKLLSTCATGISRIGRYRLDPSLLARPGRVIDVSPGQAGSQVQIPWLSYRGEDLASVLYYLSETQSPLLGGIVERVARGIQGFEGFSFNRVGSDRVGFSVRFSDKRGAVVAPNLSDGCLSMIGLTTLAYSPGRPATLCIEEPENGLTPKAARVFYETISEISKKTENPAQVLISSHSPFVIVDAWNGEHRDFIYQCSPHEGTAKVVKFADAVALGGSLKSGGIVGLTLAEQVMDGFRYTPE